VGKLFGSRRALSIFNLKQPSAGEFVVLPEADTEFATLKKPNGAIVSLSLTYVRQWAVMLSVRE
jgi:hypothetical protein